MATKGKTKKSRSKARRATKKQNNLWGYVIGVGIVALIALPFVVQAVRSSSLPGERFPSQGNAHIQLGDETPAYNSDPPTSGWHTGNIEAWGSYDYVVPEQRLIHNMEDAGVILWYQHGSVEENRAHIEALEEVSKGYRRIIIAPRENMESTYTLTAWTRLQRFDEIDTEGMRAFIDAYEGIDHHVR